MYLRYIASLHKYAINRRTYLGSTYEGLWQRKLHVPALLYALCFSNLFPSILFESDQTILLVLLLCSWMFQILVGSVLCLAFFMPPLHLRCNVVWRRHVLCRALRSRVLNSSSNKPIQELFMCLNVEYVRILQTWNIWFCVFRIFWERQHTYIKPMIIQ